MAAVHLDEKAGLGHAFAAPPVAGWATSARAADAGRSQQPLHGFAGYPNALAFYEEFGELVVIHASVRTSREGENAGADVRREAARRGSATVAVREGRRAPVLQPPSKPAEVPWREAQESGGFSAA